MIVTAFNPDISALEITYLSLASQVAQTTLTVKNTENFALNDRVLIGQMGTENAEIVTVTQAPSPGQTLVVSPLVFGHSADEAIVRLQYDQVQFWRSITGVAGNYTLLTTVTIDVNHPQLITTYNDTTGLGSYYYEVGYYNSVTTIASTLSDPVPGTGYARNTVGFLIDELLREVSDQNNLAIDPTEILGWFNEVSDDILTRTARPYTFLYTRTVLGLTAGNETVAWPTDAKGNQLMWKFDRMDFNFVNPLGGIPSTDLDDNSSNVPIDIVYPVRMLSPTVFRQLTEDQNVDPVNEILWGSLDAARQVFRFYPITENSQPGSLYCYYWAYFTQLQTYGQSFQTPTYQPYKKFVLYRFFMKLSENNEDYMSIAQIYKNEYEREVANLIKTNRKDMGSPQSLTFGANRFNSYDNNVQPYQGNRKF